MLSLQNIPVFEKFIVAGGVQLIKIWLESSDKEQKRRFEARIEDPLRQWKLSPMDLPSRKRWFDYSRARDLMLKATDTEQAPWYILRSDDKKRARLNCLAHILNLIPYKKVPREKVKMPKRSMKHAYDDQKSLERSEVRGGEVLIDENRAPTMVVVGDRVAGLHGVCRGARTGPAAVRRQNRPLGGFITNSMVVSWIVAIGLIIFARVATRDMKGVPGGAQNLLEWLVEGLYGFLESIIGPHLVKRTFWFLATIFIFILSANWFGLIPGVGTIGWGHQTPARFRD